MRKSVGLPETISSRQRRSDLINARSPSALDRLLGAKLRTIREATGLSQIALAEKVGVTFQQVQKYERGANRIPATRLMAFANILEQPLAQFLNIDDRLAPFERGGIAVEIEEAVEAFSRIGDHRIRARLITLLKVLSEN